MVENIRSKVGQEMVVICDLIIAEDKILDGSRCLQSDVYRRNW